MAEQGGSDAADLPGDVGADGEGATRHRIGEAQQIARHRIVDIAGQRLAIFGNRRRDAGIAMACHRIDHRARDARRGLRFRW